MIELFQRMHETKIFISCQRFRDVQIKTGWEIYYESVKDEEPHTTVMRAISLFKDSGLEAGQAIDLGSGAGRDTKFLLQSGWNVLAVDSSAEALKRLESIEQVSSSKLTCRLSDFVEAEFPQADLINASLSLPFCEPNRFADLWKNICSSLKRNGRFSGHFFGRNDDWATNSKMTFHTRKDIETIFAEFVIEWIEEVEGPMPLASGGVKHGHWFELVARKN
jgi:SAM-dependent methyltransferase